MSGRPKIFDNEEVISKAAEVFWRQGYEATSTEDLLAAMGIGKGSFYLAFKGGKKELYEKVLEQFDQAAVSRFRKELDAAADPVEYIREFFRSIARQPKKVHQKGCIFGNAVAELSNIDPLLMKQAAHHLQELEANFLEALHRGKQQGILTSKQEPALLARLLLNNWNGLGITRRMYPDSESLSTLIEAQLSILD
ncbi:TetR family transcriptional regulator [Chitinophaga polysaccharea]|uniref:TetR family transcriptional regulator n=1 Tax=Chitinophaga polysaccharea TaxID=1293035 RepID=A0A561PT42_9BACT|nr:TetR/AcrR family transcriptional regulator [Chitinophaga polysaccharea]TWF41289.1 TetR family transcriptional regulator [Chitinophaga polysaccharea]